MITYGKLFSIYMERYYYVLKNEKGESICMFSPEDKERYKHYIDKFDFRLIKGKDI
jgi:hypothetical protein